MENDYNIRLPLRLCVLLFLISCAGHLKTAGGKIIFINSTMFSIQELNDLIEQKEGMICKSSKIYNWLPYDTIPSFKLKVGIYQENCKAFDDEIGKSSRSSKSINIALNDTILLVNDRQIISAENFGIIIKNDSIPNYELSYYKYVYIYTPFIAQPIDFSPILTSIIKHMDDRTYVNELPKFFFVIFNPLPTPSD